MKRCHVAVIGAGSFGRHHVRHLAAHPNVTQVTVVDRDAARARAAAEANGAGVAAVGDLAGLDIDAAVVAVPTESHHAVAAPLLARGIHCLVEKPITAEPAEAKALVRAAARSRAVLQVGHIERFSGPFEALASRVGNVRHIAARRHNSPRPVPPAVDVVLDLMIHDIDLTLALAGAPLAKVSAVAPDGIGTEAASAQLTFANGAVADISASRLAPVTERTLTVHDDGGGVWHADLAARTLHRCADGAVTRIPVDTGRDNLATEIDEFIAAIEGRLVPRVDGTAGIVALRVANDIRDALSPQSLVLSA